MIDIKRDYKPMSLRRNTERFGDMYIKSATTRRLKIKKENLIALSGDAIRICQWWSFDLTEENKKKSFKALKIAAKASEAIFRLGRTPDKEQQIVIDDLLDARYDGQGLLKGGFLTAMDWQEAFFTAAIVRDKAAMDSLVKFPVSLMRQCSSKKPEAEYLLTELLQSIHRRDPHEQFMAHLKKAMQQVTEDGKKEPWVEYGTGAKLDFIIAFITNNETSPSEGLASALTEYWNYCERHCDLEGYSQPAFYMPIALLGLACMARDNGAELSVQSDFIPQFYIDGDYL